MTLSPPSKNKLGRAFLPVMVFSLYIPCAPEVAVSIQDPYQAAQPNETRKVTRTPRYSHRHILSDVRVHNNHMIGVKALVPLCYVYGARMVRVCCARPFYAREPTKQTPHILQYTGGREVAFPQARVWIWYTNRYWCI
jgi:hypothetical protein